MWDNVFQGLVFVFFFVLARETSRLHQRLLQVEMLLGIEPLPTPPDVWTRLRLWLRRKLRYESLEDKVNRGDFE